MQRNLERNLELINPGYTLLYEHREKTFLKQKLTKKENYVLFDLSEETELSDLSVQNTPVKLVEHHLSVYKKFTVTKNKKGILSPFHHTIVCDTVTIHVYFDGFGQYIQCIVKNKKDGKVLEISQPGEISNEEMKIKRASEACIKKTMEEIIKNLEEKRRPYEKEFNSSLSFLSELSQQSITNPKYLTSLQETIRLSDKASSVSFYPNYTIRNFLAAQEISIKEKLKLDSKKSAKKQPKAQSLPQEVPLELEEEKDSPMIGENAVKPKTPAELKRLFDEPLQPDESPIEYVTRKQSIIHQLWALCPKQDLNLALKITEKQTYVNQEREKYLITACVKGDVELLDGLLDEEKDVYLVKKLLYIAVIHRHIALVDFLRQKKSVKHLAIPTMTQWKPEDTELLDHIRDIDPSPLWLAYRNNDFAMFSALLDSGESSPNEKSKIGEPILCLCIAKNRLDFAKKLLDSGAKVNQPVIHSEYEISFLAEKKQKDLGRAEEHVGWTPLLYAAHHRNLAAFELLLEYNANIMARLEHGHSVFSEAAAVCPNTNPRPLCRAIIEKMISLGCDINEKLGKCETTALYYACQFKHRDAVQLLLELGADPLQTQMMDTNLGKRAGNPLLMALVRNADDIVDMILTHLETVQTPLDYEKIREIMISDYFQANDGVIADITLAYLGEEPLLSYKELKRIILINHFNRVRERILSLYEKTYYANALSAYKKNEYEKSLALFKGFFNDFPEPEGSTEECHTLLYYYSCSIFEVAKIREGEGKSQEAKELVDGAISHLETCQQLRASIERFQFLRNLSIQAQEKIAELREKQIALDAQLEIESRAQTHI